MYVCMYVDSLTLWLLPLQKVDVFITIDCTLFYLFGERCKVSVGHFYVGIFKNFHKL